MSRLIILGNTNRFTFCNAIVAAQSKSKEMLRQEITDIFVLHTQESFRELFIVNNDWIEFLNAYNININTFINRILNDNEVISFLEYIKEIIKNSTLDTLIIDLSNGTSDKKNLLSIITYVLDLSNVYCINTNMLFKKDKNTQVFYKDDIISKCYIKLSTNKEIDKLAYLNLTEVTRYKESINRLSEVYKQIQDDRSCDKFFKDNLLNAILLKIENDNKDISDNSIYRIASTAIAASLEDMIDKFLINMGIEEFDHKTLGNKIHMLQNEIKGKTTNTFDYLFFEKLNDFMLYLRNSTTHKGRDISNSEKFKAELSVQMSLVFLDYYSTIVFDELQKSKVNEEQDVVIEEIILDNLEVMYYGLDGDNTGQALESLFESNQTERKLRDFSNKIKNAKEVIVNYIKGTKDGTVIFAEGDDILFKGKFKKDELISIKNMYKEKTDGLTCSIAYANTFKELLFSMKLAKMEKDSIRGIKINENSHIL